MLLRQDAFDRPLAHRLVTNGMAMSATNYVARRYMGLYAWWPVAVHPAPRRGAPDQLRPRHDRARAGRDARARADRRRGRLARTCCGCPRAPRRARRANPLRDPRVRVARRGRPLLPADDTGALRHRHRRAAAAAGGRHREPLLARVLRAGALAAARRRRSSPTGCPSTSSSRARCARSSGGFCAVFEDCSLWSGYLLDWMLVGTRDARGPVSVERFSAQWRDPVVGDRLQEAGLDDPAQLGASFLADAPALRQLVAGSAGARRRPPLPHLPAGAHAVRRALRSSG